MKTKIGIAILVIVILGIPYKLFWNEKGVDQTYLLPLGFEGCVIINYDVEGAPSLVIENNEIIYEVPKNGIINTSSPFDKGWVNKKHSGAYQLRAFYVNEKGEKIKELPQENIRFGATGSSQEEGKQEKHYYYQIFGSKETEEQGCTRVDF